MSYQTSEQLEAAVDGYLAFCYRQGTAARVSELADFLKIGHRTLTRLSNRLLSVPARVALRSRQLSYAEGLLRETTLPVGEIGLMAGFGDRGTFHRAIKRQFGCTPQAIRTAVLKCHLTDHSFVSILPQVR